MIKELETPPLTYEKIENPKVEEAVARVIDRFIKGSPASGSLDNLLTNVKRASQEFKMTEGARELGDDKVELYLDWIFSILRLDRKTLTEKGHDALSTDEKVLSARMQHEQVDHVIYASGESASDTHVQNTYAVVNNLVRHIHRLDRSGLVNAELAMRFEGIRNELAIVRSFLEFNKVNPGKQPFRVFLPDYGQDLGEVDDEDNAVFQMDIKNGIDMIVVTPDKQIVLIDTKGARKYNEVTFKDSRLIWKGKHSNPLVQKAIMDVARMCGLSDLDRVFQTAVIIPTLGDSFEKHDLGIIEKTDISSQLEDLRNYGRLKQKHMSDIINGIFDLGKPVSRKVYDSG